MTPERLRATLAVDVRTGHEAISIDSASADVSCPSGSGICPPAGLRGTVEGGFVRYDLIDARAKEAVSTLSPPAPEAEGARARVRRRR